MKFSRKYYSDALLPESCNSKEVGAVMAHAVLAILDPLVADKTKPEKPPVFTAAKVVDF